MYARGWGEHFGQKVYFDGKAKLWRFDDDDSPIWNQDGSSNLGDRVCPKCHLRPTAEGHDPCIANLPGVAYACCGHGTRPGYVKFNHGLVLRGEFDHVRKGEFP